MFRSPIVVRELSEYSRRAWTYWIRTLLALGGLSVIFFAVMAKDFQLGRGDGRHLFTPLAIGLFLAANAIGLRSTYDCIGRERREGTLGLMYLTGLRSETVLAAKVASSGLQNVWAVLAVLPILGICLLLGGVTGMTYFKVILAIAATLRFAMQVGLYHSCTSNDEHQAFSKSIRSLACLNIIPFIGPAWLMFWAVYTSTPSLYLFFVSLLCCYLQSRTYWSLANEAFEREWRNPLQQLEPKSGEAHNETMLKISFGKGKNKNGKALRERSACGDINPAEWLIKRYADVRQVTPRIIAPLFTVLTLFVSFLLTDQFNIIELAPFYISIMGIGRVLVMAAMAKLAPQSFGEISANGALEILQTTPLRLYTLVDQVKRFLYRELAIGGGVFLLADAIFIFLLNENAHRPDGQDVERYIDLIVRTNLIFFPILLSSAVVGIWMGVKHGSLAKGAFWTAGLLIAGPVIPLLFFGVSMQIIIVTATYSIGLAIHSYRRLADAIKQPEQLSPS